MRDLRRTHRAAGGLPGAAHRGLPCLPGGVAHRRFSPVGLVGRARRPADPAPSTGGPPLCQSNPDVPGLCHMTPEAGRAWVARARGDIRSPDRELERRETAVRDRPGAVLDPVSHDHGGASRHHHHTTTDAAPTTA